MNYQNPGNEEASSLKSQAWRRDVDGKTSKHVQNFRHGNRIFFVCCSDLGGVFLLMMLRTLFFKALRKAMHLMKRIMKTIKNYASEIPEDSSTTWASAMCNAEFT